MLRICWNWLVHDEAPSGANRRRVELLNALLAPQHQHRVEHVVLLLRNDTPAPVADSRVITERVNVAPGAAMRLLYETKILTNTVRKHRCDVALQESFPVPEIRPVPLILTIHDLRDVDPAAKAGASIRGFFAPAVIRAGLARAARVIAVSNFTKNAIQQFSTAAEGKVDVIYNSAGHLKAPGSAPPREPGRILYVGHLETRKGVDILLDAFAVLHTKMPEATLTFCGDGPLAPKLQYLASRIGDGSRVQFIESVGDAELLNLYLTASLAAIPSRYEGFSIPLLEAMQLGTPVVAARTSALPDVAGETVIFVNSLDPAEWAASLENALRNPGLLQTNVRAARERAAEFQWSASAEKLLVLLESLK